MNSRTEDEAPHGLRGMKFKFDHDLDPSDEFIAEFPPIKQALKDDRLNAQFFDYKRQAQSRKKTFAGLGFISLLFGFFSLAAIAIQVMLGEASARLGPVWIITEAAGVVSFALMLIERMMRNRRRWCKAVFFRERLRQWHFQKFLDGELIELLVADPARYESELTRRWNLFHEQFGDGDSMMNRFVRNREKDLLHKPTQYSDIETEKLVQEAMRILRIEHQLGYGTFKIDPESDQQTLAIREQLTWSEAVAAFSLAGAVMIGALTLLFRMIPGVQAGGQLLWPGFQIERFLGGVALLLTVVSATTRAYRAGNTLPDESESYEEYCGSLREIEVVFDSSRSIHEKFRHLEHLERESAEELRRFLRMKLRATFIF
jgi:hypothetical protein